MLYWALMTGFSLLMPVMMVIFGRIFTVRPPEDINMSYGYRTHMSMLNQDTWDFAHRVFGRSFFRLGVVSGIVTLAFMLLFTVRPENEASIAGVTAMVCQVFTLILPIAKTEKSLRDTFDKDGNRK